MLGSLPSPELPWCNVTAAVNYEVFTLPLLFCASEEFTEYHHAMRTQHARKAPSINASESICLRARRCKEEGQHVKAFELLVEGCTARLISFSRDDYQVTAAVEHAAWSGIHLAVVDVANKQMETAYTLFSETEKLMLMLGKAPLDSPPSLGHVRLAPVQRDAVLFALYHNWSNYFVIRRLWEPAAKFTEKAQRHWQRIAGESGSVPLMLLSEVFAIRHLGAQLMVPSRKTDVGPVLGALSHTLDFILEQKGPTVGVEDNALVAVALRASDNSSEDVWIEFSFYFDRGLSLCDTCYFLHRCTAAIAAYQRRRYDDGAKLLADVAVGDDAAMDAEWQRQVGLLRCLLHEAPSKNLAQRFALPRHATRHTAGLHTQTVMKRYIRAQRAAEDRQRSETALRRKLLEEGKEEFDEDGRARWALPPLPEESAGSPMIDGEGMLAWKAALAGGGSAVAVRSAVGARAVRILRHCPLASPDRSVSGVTGVVTPPPRVTSAGLTSPATSEGESAPRGLREIPRDVPREVRCKSPPPSLDDILEKGLDEFFDAADVRAAQTRLPIVEDDVKRKTEELKTLQKDIAAGKSEMHKLRRLLRVERKRTLYDGPTTTVVMDNRTILQKIEEEILAMQNAANQRPRPVGAEVLSPIPEASVDCVVEDGAGSLEGKEASIISATAVSVADVGDSALAKEEPTECSVREETCSMQDQTFSVQERTCSVQESTPVQEPVSPPVEAASISLERSPAATPPAPAAPLTKAALTALLPFLDSHSSSYRDVVKRLSIIRKEEQSDRQARQPPMMNVEELAKRIGLKKMYESSQRPMGQSAKGLKESTRKQRKVKPTIKEMVMSLIACGYLLAVRLPPQPLPPLRPPAKAVL